MGVNILNLIDFGKVDILLEGFFKTTGFVTAILDLEGNILSRSGWRRICIDFHRINPETSERCTYSDTVLAGKLASGAKYHSYRCLNGLVDVALPIVIKGEHIANLFSGQFLFEQPDIAYFKEQAKTFGFNETEYLKALENVPVVSKEQVTVTMEFLLNMTQLITEMTFQKLEQMELNKSIGESEDKFKSVFESANVGKSITLVTGEINVNQAFCDMLGYMPVELQNKKWQDLTPEEDIPEVQNILEHLLRGEKDSARFEKRYICKNGSLIWGDVSTSLRHDAQGKPVYFITTMIDVTDHKRAEEELRKSEEKYRLLFETNPHPMWVYDLETLNFLEVNEAAVLKYGFSKDEFLEMNLKDIRPVEDIERLLDNVSQASDNLSFSGDWRHKDKNGNVFRVEIISHSIKYKDKNARLVLANDISRRKQAEEKILQQLDELKRWQEVTLGREDRIRQLKREVNELLIRNGEKTRYPSQNEDVPGNL
jgi:PAS domain S-box-containing protein